MIPALRNAIMGALRFVVELGGITGNDVSSTTTTVYSGIQFKDEGSIYKRSGGAASTYTDSSEDWGAANRTGKGAFYWVRATVTSGTLTSGTTGSWVQISTEPIWYCADFDPSAAVFTTATLTFEVSSDSSGSPIVDTVTGIVLKANRVP